MPESRDFYVGYLPVPPRLVRFLRRIVPALLAVALVASWSVSRAQEDPGAGVWHNDVQVLTGRIAATPYPLLRIPRPQTETGFETILLVSEGKHGAGERAAALDGQLVQARGTILERDGRRLLELADENPLAPVTGSAAPGLRNLPDKTQLTPQSLGRMTLSGEIIDPKCYSGAMKPGAGKTHKACATLCIAGGIPPMFVGFDATDQPHYYLLTDAIGQALRDAVLQDRVLPFVADDVDLSGEREIWGDLAILKLDLDSIKRR